MRRLVLCTLLLALPAHAQDLLIHADDLMKRPTLLGDFDETRTRLEEQGIQLGGDEIAEVLGNPRGGHDQGAIVEGRLELYANVDLAKTFGWGGMTLHANAYQIHGQGLTARDLDNLVTASNIEAEPSTRLFTLWLQQSLWNDAVSIRFGEIADDDEFFVSQYAPLFVNATYGWPSIMGINLPSGGPAYPLARPGVRLRAAVSPQLVWSGAVFSGDSRTNETGFNTEMNGDVFAINELAYTISTFGLPGTMKLGGWYHSGPFADQQVDGNGASLALGGMPRLHRGDYGGYFIWDQLLWRTGASDSGLAGFVRIGGDPPQRDLISLHLDAGLTFTGAFGRDSDVIGLGASYEGVSEANAQVSRAFGALNNLPVVTPDYESVVELSYQTQLAPWLILQPDVQWIVHPGAKLLDTSAPLAKNPDALVLGLRTAINL
jgi:porin